jgi:anti-anti-sigma factor
MIEVTLTSHDPLTLAVSGQLDTLATAAAEAQFEALLSELSGKILLDLSRLTYISSSGLRLLLKLKRDGAAHGRDVAVVNATAMVDSIFKITGLDTIFY